jgi:hypothetical protein
MPLQIPLSQAGSADGFAARVAAFRDAKRDHHKTVGEPAPASWSPPSRNRPAMGINCMTRIA